MTEDTRENGGTDDWATDDELAEVDPMERKAMREAELAFDAWRSGERLAGVRVPDEFEAFDAERAGIETPIDYLTVWMPPEPSHGDSWEAEASHTGRPFAQSRDYEHFQMEGFFEARGPGKVLVANFAKQMNRRADRPLPAAFTNRAGYDAARIITTAAADVTAAVPYIHGESAADDSGPNGDDGDGE